MRRYILLLLLSATISQSSFADPKTLQDLLRAEEKGGYTHFSAPLSNWIQFLMPFEQKLLLMQPRRQLNEAIEKLSDAERELGDAEGRLRMIEDQRNFAKQQYQGALQLLDLSVQLLSVDKPKIPALLKSLEASTGKSSVQMQVAQPWLKMIASEVAVPSLADANLQVTQAWGAFKHVLEAGRRDQPHGEEEGFVVLPSSADAPVDSAFLENLIAGLANLDGRLTNLISKICQEGNAKEPGFCGDGTEKALSQILAGELARLNGPAKGASSKENPLKNKLIRHLTERYVVRVQLKIVRDLAENESRFIALKRSVDARRADVAQLRSAVEQKRIQTLDGLRKENLFNHRMYTIALEHIVEKIRECAQSKKDATIVFGPRDDKKIVVPIKDLRGAFITIMHGLEQFEYAVVDELGDKDPYPEVAMSYADWLDNFFNPVKGPTYQDILALYGENPPRDNNIRETKKEIMWNYYLALYGMKTTADLYKGVAKDLKDRLAGANLGDVKAFLKSFTASNIISYINDFRQFSEDYPILAIDFVRNLRHSYSIMFPESQLELVNSIQRTYVIKEAENVARDWLMGDLDHAYVKELTRAPPSLAALAFIDFAERAPYLCAAYKGAQGKTFVSGWVQTFLGNGLAGKGLGLISGVIEVKGEKYLASKISREHELAASVMRRAFSNFYAGKNAKEIAISAAAYLATRQIVREIGTIKALSANKMLLEDVKGCATQSGKEGALGALAATPLAILAGAATTVTGIFALPIVVVGAGIVVCGAVTMVAVDRLSGRRARRISAYNRKFLERFVLPEIRDESQRAGFDKARRISDAQVDAIVEQTQGIRDEAQKQARQLALYQAEVNKNIDSDEEEDFREGFKDAKVPSTDPDPLTAKWARVQAAAGKSERADIAREALALLPEKGRSNAEQKLAEKISQFIQALSGEISKEDSDARVSEISDDIRLLPFREMKDELVLRSGVK